MKKIGVLLITIAFISMSFAFLREDKLTVDTENSTITWKGYKPTGSHTGTIELASGELTMKGDRIKKGSFIAKMSSIKDLDGSKRLEKHLKSKDFFEVEVYPTATFEITKVKSEGETFLITGNLTIKDITKKIAFPASISKKDGEVILTGEKFQINRTDFNVKYKSKSFFANLKDKFINDEFDLQVKIIAKK